MAEQEFRFEASETVEKSKIAGLCEFIWNKNTNEFLGRTGISWAKVSFFYAIFYTFLGSFFIGMLAVFFQIMPLDKPTYYGFESTMHQKGLNPGLGFRPQIDVEDNLIHFNPNVYDGVGYKPYFENLRIFLEDKYASQGDAENLIDCVDGQNYASELENGKACKYNYEEIFANTSCTAAKTFGYNSGKVCVLIKLNKIVSWNLEKDDQHVKITCEGETSVDLDNMKAIKYHSENNLENTEAGYLNGKYFPYFNQKGYRAPFVFVEIEPELNTLVNIRCIASAKNIDNADRTNLRGMTKFSIYLTNK